MFRFGLLAMFLGEELIAVAKAMADGSYYRPTYHGGDADALYQGVIIED